MNQIKNETNPTLLKCLFIAVPIGMLLTNSKLPGMAHNPILAVGIVWLVCLGVMTQNKYKMIQTPLKSLIIAVPVGLLLVMLPGIDSSIDGSNFAFVIGIVWLFCLGIMIRQRLLKCLFLAGPLGFVLTVITLIWKHPDMPNPLLTIGVIWLVCTVILWPVCLGVMWLINKLARQSKLDNVTAQSTSEKLCPYCAEEIKFAVTLCRYCRSNLDSYIQDKHIFAFILVAIFIACFNVSKELRIISSSIGSLESTVQLK